MWLRPQHSLNLVIYHMLFRRGFVSCRLQSYVCMLANLSRPNIHIFESNQFQIILHGDDLREFRQRFCL